MDVMSMCSSSPTSNQSAPRKISDFTSSLPSPPLLDTVNEKKRSSLPPLTSITSILHSPVPSSHEINPNSQPHHDTSINQNLHHHTPQDPPCPPSQMNYQSIPQRSSLASPPSSSYDTSLWSRQPQPLPPNTSYYHQSFQQQQQPPPPPYAPHNRYNSSNYPPAYATATSYNSSGNRIGGEDDSPYIPRTTEQSLAKMGKVIDYCNQISHFATQYRDMRMNYNLWNGQVTDSAVTDMINKTYDVLNILNGLRNEITRPSTESQDEIDLIRKQRTISTTSRTKYRKRSKRAAPPGRCHSCNISETPEWRRGPDGARTLCNACGLHFAKITRKRALSAMQQVEQQQQLQQQQQQQQPNDNGNVSNSNFSNNNSSMPTPGASDVERDSPHAKQPMIEIIDD